MLKKIKELIVKPEVFVKSTEAFWDDEHISKFMLEAHLNPEWDAASRKHDTIKKSVDWINTLVEKEAEILDLGCGPGLYANMLSESGRKVIGIDYSKRSINHAKEDARKRGLDTEYIYQNYLDINYKEEFDAVLLIYCDLGALTNIERDLLLKKIYKALKPGGIFIFDVHSFHYKMNTGSSFNYEKEGEGFFAESEHLELKQTFYYEEHQTYLEQYTIVSNEKIKQHRVFKQLYDRAKLQEILIDFHDIKFFADVTGKSFHRDSRDICIVSIK